MIHDPAVRALTNELTATFRRMAAIEGRHLPSITTLKEVAHEQQLSAATHTPDCLGTGEPASASPAIPPFNAIVANALETLRKPRTWP